MTATDPNSGSAPAKKASGRIWRPWRWFFGGLSTLLVVALVVVGWAVTTQSGLRTVVGFAQQAMPDVLSVKSVQGRLIDRIQVADFRLRLPSLQVTIGAVDLAWQPARLLGGTLHVTSLQAQDTQVLLAPSKEPKSQDPLRLPDLESPLAIELDQAIVERLALGSSNDPDTPWLVLARAQLAASARRSGLDLRALDVDLAAPELTAHAGGRIELQGQYPVDLALKWNLARAPAVILQGEGQIRGDLTHLRLDHRVSGSLDLRLDADLHHVLADPSWQASVALAAVNVPQLVEGGPQVDISAQLSSQGDLDRAGVNGAFEAVAPEHAEMGRVSADLDLVWQDRQLEINALSLTEEGSGAMFDLQGVVDLDPATGHVDVSGVWQQLRWPLTGAAQVESPNGTLDVNGRLDAFTYKLTAAVFGEQIPETQIALTGQGDQQGARLAEAKVDGLGGYVVGKGAVIWNPTLGWDIALTARDIDPGRQWSGYDGQVALKAESKGSLADGFEYQLKADLGLKAYPNAVLNLAGKGSATAVQLESLGIDTLGGRVTGRGALNWAPEIAWDADIAVADIDPGRHYPDWNGRLSGELTSSGTLSKQGPDLQARIAHVAGELRGYPIELAALLDMKGSRIDVRELDLGSGATRITATGTASDQLALNFRLNSPNLGELLPQGKGQLNIDGKLVGTVQAPRVTLTIDGKDIDIQDQVIAAITGDADIGLGANDPIRANVIGKNLLVGGMRFDRVSLKADGSLPAHRLTADIKGEPLSAQLVMSGERTAAGGYQASLSQLTLTTAKFGHWRLQRNAPVAINQGSIQAGPLCVTEKQGSAGCVQFAQPQPGVFDTSLKIDRVNFDLFDDMLPPNLDLSGRATLDASFHGKDAALTGQANLRIPQGSLQVAIAGAPEPLVFSNTALGVVASAAGLDAKLSVPIEDLGVLDVQAALPGFSLQSQGMDKQALKGRARMELKNLQPIGALMPSLSGFAGTADADFVLGGTVAAPGLEGQARLRQLAFQLPLLGLKVADLNVTAKMHGADRLDLSGGADIGGGKLALSGNGLRSEAGWTLEFQLRGDQLKVADTKEYFALLDTDLRGGIGPGGGSLQGDVAVQEARIRPRSIPAGTVANSPDVVVAQDGGGSTKNASPFHVDVAIKLVKPVLIDAFGLRGSLRGTLRAIEEPNQPLLGDGQLEILDGTYRLSSQFGVMASVGAPLKITQGILVFAKTPLTNPGLVLQAQREGTNVTAGVRVLGTLKNPKLAFFSETSPNMTDAEIVNYLVTGVPPRGKGGADQSLSLGTYIAPNLFLEYDTNLGDEADKVKLRYDVNSWLQIQTETGDSQGADIFFKFEN